MKETAQVAGASITHVIHWWKAQLLSQGRREVLLRFPEAQFVEGALLY